MQVIRRLYVYSISLISLEVVLWGSIGLLRSAFTQRGIGNGTVQLAGALALILVGLPVFLIHWTMAQRSAQRDREERSARLRAVFLYGVLLATLIPIAQNILGFFDGLLLKALGAPLAVGMFGESSPWSFYLFAVVINAIAAAYFFNVLWFDWRSEPLGDPFSEIRRLYRYVWLIYGLVLVTFGIQQIIQFILELRPTIGSGSQASLAHGLALVIVGLPVWLFTGRIVAQSLGNPAERESLLRLVVLYLLVFVSAAVSLISGGMLLFEIITITLAGRFDWMISLSRLAVPISTVIPAVLVWIYYGRSLAAEMNQDLVERPAAEAAASAVIEKDLQQRAALKRLYYYVLSLLGLGASFIGLQALLSTSIDLVAREQFLGGAALQTQLSAALAAIVVGLPVWIINWRPMSAEARLEGEAGDHARRSVIRKGYLYLILFIAVIGVMVTAGFILYHLIRALLGDPADHFGLEVLKQLTTLLLFVVFGAYHWIALRKDASLAERSLDRRYAQYPVIVLSPEGSDFGQVFGDAFHRFAPGLPVALHPVSDGAPDATLMAARAVILPADLAARPSEAIRLWLQNFSGERLVVTTPAEGWNWIPGAFGSLESLAKQAVSAVRQLAEDQPVPGRRESHPFMIVVYLFAGLFTLEIILFAISLGVSILFN